MKKLKCLLYHLIIRGIVKTSLTLEVHIVDEDIESFKQDFILIQKLLFNGYNLVILSYNFFSWSQSIQRCFLS
jgi:hypothetical protein